MDGDKLNTSIGVVEVMPTGDNHIYVGTGSNTDIVIRGVLYYLGSHFYLWRDGTYHLGEEDKQRYEQRQSCYLSRRDHKPTTPAATDKAIEVLTDALNKWVESHKRDILQATLNAATEALRKIEQEREEALAKADSLMNDIIKQASRVESLTNELSKWSD